MWNSWSKLRKEWNLQGWSTKKSHSLWVFYFGLRVFKGCNTLLCKLTYFDLQVFQNFQDNPNISGVFKKAFPQPPCLFVFFWSRLLAIERKNKTSLKFNLLKTTSKVYAFLLFTINLLVYHMKVFVFTK